MYSELRRLFDAADKKYNSGLFELIDEEKWQFSGACPKWYTLWNDRQTHTTFIF